MLHFIHAYLPKTDFWDGLVRRGFIDDTSGVKLCCEGTVKECAMGGGAATRGRALDRRVCEATCYFWMDRIQGGIAFCDYDNDPALIRYYTEKLGSRFLGFQLHELGGNLVSDYHRVIGDYGSYRGLEAGVKLFPKTLDELENNIKKDFGTVYVETQTAEEWLSTPPMVNAKNISDFVKKTYRKRGFAKDGTVQPLLHADSYTMLTRIQRDLGLKNYMPEIGGQTPLTRLQVAVARGNARAIGVPFGTYQEPWGGSPFSCCYYKRDPLHEWNLYDISGVEPEYEPAGERGGSSMSLLRRIFFYSLFAGAEWLSEEWGACNTFYDWQDFEITPYGKIKYDFLDFVRKNPDLGKAYTPIALVLPSDAKMISTNTVAHGTNYFRFTEDTPVMDDREKELHIYDILRRIYFDRNRHNSAEYDWRAITNSPFGDLFDIRYDDDAGLFDNYEYAVDLTGSASFAEKNRAYIDRILPADDGDELEHILHVVIDRISPVCVEGDCLWMLNETADGYALAVFNNNGVMRSVADGEQLDHSFDRIIKVTRQADGGSFTPILSDAENLQITENTLTMTLPAGGIAVFRFPCKK
ncbi:MAG: hypothetical protein MJ175_03950 [Clostridia bacterium]|nr:hypothetical protein [Clostridia bacterium]